MRQITKGPEPPSLTRHRLAASADYNNYSEKEDLRQALAREQRGLCCYCLSRIHPTSHSMKIEHWRSQRRFPADQLNYSNLLGACAGNPGQPPELQHCDTRKGDQDLSRNPADRSHCIDRDLRYHGDGRILSDDAVFDAQLNDVLNLNHPFLRNNRKATLDAFQASLAKYGTLPESVLKRWLFEWSGNTHNIELPPFSAVIAYWLRKRLARIKISK